MADMALSLQANHVNPPNVATFMLICPRVAKLEDAIAPKS